jgi:RimJ/RimL family protein N-acetyltransferase
MEKKARYPVRRACRHNLTLEIRPITEDDIPELHAMHSSLEESERSLLRQDVLDPHYENQVKRQISDRYILRLVAWHEGRILGILALHRDRKRWMQHSAELRIIIHSAYRREGISMALFDEVVPFAKEHDIEKLYVHILPAQTAGIELAKRIGFSLEATLRDHIKDKYNSYHDVHVYALDLEAPNKAMEELISSFNDYTG